ncbi:unnamed protein product, partial [Ectocarpus sp. 13 AM-2016]
MIERRRCVLRYTCDSRGTHDHLALYSSKYLRIHTRSYDAATKIAARTHFNTGSNACVASSIPDTRVNNRRPRGKRQGWRLWLTSTRASVIGHRSFAAARLSWAVHPQSNR